MKILLLDDLVNQGVIASEIRRSLSINCFGKTFHRKSDLPKKFKEKALNICKEILDIGKESFILETNYSYTIWEEEIAVKEKIKPEYLSTVSGEIRENKTEKINDIPLPLSSENSRELLETNSSMKEKDGNREIFAVENKYNLFQYTSREDRVEIIKKSNSNRRISAQHSEEMEDIKTYRGVVVNNNKSIEEEIIVEEKTISKHKVKPRTYRGITY
ncbi:hypothetical protein [Geminocystis sp.]|uniref:hypothetical protein n=1 Tax=Geminocystis sp. TaxID=2664100 RepID=UPI0035930CA1